MPESPSSFAELLQKRILPNVLRIAILVSTIGFAFLLLHLPGADQLIMIGLSSLAMAFFFLAYVPLSVSTTNKPDLYALITYKIICIGSSVATIGILFQFLKLQGAPELLMIGAATTGISLIASVVLVAKNKDNGVVLNDAIMRGTGIFLVCVYMMQQASIF
ncbi:MAG: hypothetical protein RI909_336 [Bacteroidota bacterium]|jgi:hypothetical protein